MLKTVIAFTALVAAGSAQAAVLFDDNFDAEGNVNTSSLNYASFANWTVSDGTVDLVKSGAFSIDCVGGSGKCVDLDGSTSNSGTLLSKPIAFSAGQPVIITFDVSGNQRGGGSDLFLFEVLMGGVYTYDFQILTGFTYGGNGILNTDTTGTYEESLTPDRPFVTYGLSLDFNAPGTLQLRFATTSNDNIGPILDNVLVSQSANAVVPEPATWAMLIAGFGLVGTAMRRRRTTVAA